MHEKYRAKPVRIHHIRDWFIRLLALGFLSLFAVIPVTTMIAHAQETTSPPQYGGPLLRLPWLNTSSGISGYTYNCGDHDGPIDGHTYTWDKYAIDFGLQNNTPVTAVFSGTVTIGPFEGTGIGYNLWVTTTDGAYRAIYAHLTQNSWSSYGITSGSTVIQGQILALSGSSGNSSGPHLHFSLRSGGTGPYDGTAVIPEPMSGYTGFGDPNSCVTPPTTKYNPEPGGWWIGPTPTGGSSNPISSGTTVNLGFQTQDNINLGVSYVTFTKSTDNGQTWSKVKTTPDIHGQVFSSFTFTGPTLISTDVYDANGSYQLAPSGVRKLCTASACPSDQFSYWDGSSSSSIGAGGGGPTKVTTCAVDPNANGIILFRDVNYGTNGGCLLVTADTNDLGPSTFQGFGSLKFVGTFAGHNQVVTYVDANYGTVCATYNNNQSDLRDCANKVVSLKVQSFTPPANQANNIAKQAVLDHSGANAATDDDLTTTWLGGHSVPLGLVFANPVTIQKVVVFDRAQNSPDNNQINKVQLVFSDGTVINNIDMTSGGPRCAEVSIPAKQVSWVNVVPTDSSGTNGFEDIQVWDNSGTVYSQNNCVMKYSLTPASGTGPSPLVTVPTAPSTPSPSPTAMTSSQSIYEDSLASSWQDWSFGSTHTVTDTAHPNAGSKDIALTVTTAYGSLYLHNASGVNTQGYTNLVFALRATQAGQSMQVQLRDSSDNVIGIPLLLANYGGDPVAGSYKVYSVPLVDLGGANTVINGIDIQDHTGTVQPVMYIDSISLRAPMSVVYDDALASGWQDWSWNSNRNLTDTTAPFSGSKDIAWTITSAFGGLYLHYTGLITTGYSTVVFAIKATQSGQSIKVQLHDNNDAAIGNPVVMTNYGGDPVANNYIVYSIPLADLGGVNKTIDGIVIQDNIGAPQPVMYVDSVSIQ